VFLGARRRRGDRAVSITTALALAALCVALLAAIAPLASAKNQGYPQNYKTEIRALKPPVPGLELSTTGGDRFLVLANGTGKNVVVTGYDGDAYLRFLSNRVVEVNLHSPSKYVNEDRFGTLQPPASARPGAAPKWKAVSRNGSYRWFDHRIHWMEKSVPPQVKDTARRTKIFDWEVPLKVDGKPVIAAGTLTWVPDSSSGTSTGLIVGIAAGVLALLAASAVLLRRRRRPSADRPRDKAPKEAW
jgi:hypothetical protein